MKRKGDTRDECLGVDMLGHVLLKGDDFAQRVDAEMDVDIGCNLTFSAAIYETLVGPEGADDLRLILGGCPK